MKKNQIWGSLTVYGGIVELKWNPLFSKFNGCLDCYFKPTCYNILKRKYLSVLVIKLMLKCVSQLPNATYGCLMSFFLAVTGCLDTVKEGKSVIFKAFLGYLKTP